MVRFLDDFLEYQFPRGEFALFGSAPLVVRGIKATINPAI